MKTIATLTTLVLCVFKPCGTFGAPAKFMPQVAFDLLTGQKENLQIDSKKKGKVLVFLSATCPCSNSHLKVLKDLAADFKDFDFVAIHSNQNEKENESKDYFQKAELGFPVLQDTKAQIADQYGALKTPHVFVFDSHGLIKYQGGVTDSAYGPTAKNQFLRYALLAMRDGQNPQFPLTKVLGCYIAR